LSFIFALGVRNRKKQEKEGKKAQLYCQSVQGHRGTSIIFYKIVIVAGGCKSML